MRRREDVASHVVHPPFARLVRERQPADRGQKFVGGELRGNRTRGGARFLHRGRERRFFEDDPKPVSQGQQIVDGDRPLGGDRLVERAVRSGENSGVGELWRPGLDRVFESEYAVAQQRCREDSEQWFAERRDAKRGVFGHGLGRSDGQQAGREDLGVVPLGSSLSRSNPRNHPRYAPICHLVLERTPHRIKLRSHTSTVPRSVERVNTGRAAATWRPPLRRSRRRWRQRSFRRGRCPQ